MTILKEKGIVLTSYERKSLIRFLALYLSSVFALLAIIGYLFFENNRVSMIDAMKYEMMYQGRLLSSEIIMRGMSDQEQDQEERIVYLKSLKHGRFVVGYYTDDYTPILTNINHIAPFQKEFSIHQGKAVVVVEDPSAHYGVRYVVLMENELDDAIAALRIRIISYLIFSFMVMTLVGYFLGRLFLKPVREQIEALDQFITDTTHELNTPITAILMTIDSLKDVETKKLQRLRASAKKLSIMYGSMTHRLEGGVEEDQRLDIAKVIEERVECMQELIDSKHLHLNVAVETHWMTIAQSAIERLIDNLLSNAIKYSDRNDTIGISLREGQLVIEDSGIGIDAAKYQDIFKRYHRANKERGGFGIGLSIVKEICETYHIKITLLSEEGRGTTFILTFPKQF